MKKKSKVQPNDGLNSSGADTPKHIVLVDDCPVLSEDYAEALRDLGFNVSVFVSPTLFLKRLRGDALRKTDMFILDVMLTKDPAVEEPPSDAARKGIRIAQELRMSKKYEDIPIILFSATPLPAILESASKAAETMTDKNASDCVFIETSATKCPPAKLARIVADYFIHEHFPQKSFIHRLILHLPFLPFLHYEIERRH